MKFKFLNITYLLLIGWVFNMPVVEAQDVTDTIRFTLNEAKAYALTNNKTIIASQMDVEIAKRKVRETVTIGLPQLNLDGSYQHIFDVPSFGIPVSGLTTEDFGFDGVNYNILREASDPGGYLATYTLDGPSLPIMEQDNATFDFKVSQLIFSGEYIVGLQASKVYKTISEQNLTKNKLDVMQQVEGTYYMLLVFKENLSIVKKNKELTSQTLAEMKAMFEQGFIEDTELDQLQLNLTRLTNLEISLNGQIKNTLNLLKYQLGMDYAQPLDVVDSISDFIRNLPPVYNDQFDINQNIEYQMVTNQVEVSKLNLRREKSTFLPVIAGFYNHQERWKSPAFDLQPKDIAGISLTLPLFTSGQRLFKVKQASIDLDKSEVQKTQLNEGLQLKYQNKLLDYETAYNSYLNEKDNSEISEKIFNKTNVKYKEGMVSSLDLTQVQIQYLTAVNEYYTSVLKLLNTKSEIDRLLSKNQ